MIEGGHTLHEQNPNGYPQLQTQSRLISMVPMREGQTKPGWALWLEIMLEKLSLRVRRLSGMSMMLNKLNAWRLIRLVK